jgi:hypothetical protein
MPNFATHHEHVSQSVRKYQLLIILKEETQVSCYVLIIIAGGWNLKTLVDP